MSENRKTVVFWGEGGNLVLTCCDEKRSSDEEDKGNSHSAIAPLLPHPTYFASHHPLTARPPSTMSTSSEPIAVASPPVSPSKADTKTTVEATTDVHLQHMKEALKHGKDSSEFQAAVFDALVHGALENKDKVVTVNMAGIQFVTEVEDSDTKTTSRFILLGKQNKEEKGCTLSYNGTWASFGGKPVSGKADKKDKEMAQFDHLKMKFPKFLDHFKITSFDDWVGVEKKDPKAVAIRETWEEMNGAASFEDLLAWVERSTTRPSCNNGLLDFAASLVGGDPFDRFLFAGVNYLVPISTQEALGIMFHFRRATHNLVEYTQTVVEVSDLCLVPANIFSRDNEAVDALFQPGNKIEFIELDSKKVDIWVVSGRILSKLTPGSTLKIASFKVRDVVIWERPIQDLAMTGVDVDATMTEKPSTD